MALALYDRVQETSTANTTVSFTLTGAVTGFQTFAAVGNTNTTYYSATDSSGNWEVGTGTYSTTGPTLTRTTILSSSNSNTAVTLSGTVNVFVTLPSQKAGSVTNVAQSFTGGIISVAGSPITASGTLALTVAGTSGGIPYFGSASTWASSSALTQYGVVIGGGAGAAPTSTAAGTSTTVLHGNASGTPTFGAVSLTADVSGQLPVANGGTGTNTLTANNVILGNGASAPNFVAPSTSGNVLSSNGTTWVSQAVSVPAGAQIYTSLNFGGF